MKNMLFFLSVMLLIVSGCSNENSVTYEETDEVPDENPEEMHDESAEQTEQSQTEADIDTAETIDESEITDSDDNGIDPGLEKTGEYSVSFNGPLNTDMNNFQSIEGGTGNADFSHNGAPIIFTDEVSVPFMFNFPIAVLQQGNILVMWLDKIEFAGQQTRQVFAVTLPSETEPGEYTMENAQSYVFYGDIDINIQGGGFDIKCVRSGSPFGDLSISENNGAFLIFSAEGFLYDPSVLGDQIPYPVCED